MATRKKARKNAGSRNTRTIGIRRSTTRR